MLIWQKVDHVFICNQQIVNSVQFSNILLMLRIWNQIPTLKTILCAKNIDKYNSSFYLKIDSYLA